MFYIVECFRRPIFQGELPNLEICCLGFLVAAASLAIGYLVFSRLSDRFVYYV
jgi:ABC-type polysaccharide/polyol phosphate export permease